MAGCRAKLFIHFRGARQPNPYRNSERGTVASSDHAISTLIAITVTHYASYGSQLGERDAYGSRLGFSSSWSEVDGTRELRSATQQAGDHKKELYRHISYARKIGVSMVHGSSV